MTTLMIFLFVSLRGGGEKVWGTYNTMAEAESAQVRLYDMSRRRELKNTLRAYDLGATWAEFRTKTRIEEHD